MDNSKLTKLDNYKNTVSVKNKRLHKTLDTLGELLGIEFGSITVKFHDGKWNRFGGVNASVAFRRWQ